MYKKGAAEKHSINDKLHTFFHICDLGIQDLTRKRKRHKHDAPRLCFTDSLHGGR